MLKKLLFMAMVVAFAAVSFGQPNLGTVYHEVQVVDEEGMKVTDITEVDIYNVGTTTSSTIYKERGAVGAITLPMLTDSTNTTLSSGYFYWWGPAGYDFSITDDTNTHTNYGFRARTASETKITFPSYLHAASTTEWGDDESITLGESSDWVINAGTTNDLLTFTPATDGAVFRVGLAAGTKSADLQWYTASGVGLMISESANTFAITGLTTTINTSSSYATSINAGSGTGDVHILDGTGTGSITIGSGASGVWAIDGTLSGTINADESIAITVSAGTIGIAATGGDITIDATDKSVIIRGTEAATDAILLDADAGSIDIDSADNITIDVADDIIVTTAGGTITLSGTGSDMSLDCTDASLKLDSGEATDDALNFDAGAGGLDVDVALSLTLTSSEEEADAVDIEASGTAGGVIIASGTGDITLDSGDDIFLAADTSSGDVISIINTQGTHASAVIIRTAGAGSIDIDSGDNITVDVADDITVDTAEGKIHLIADGVTAGDITLDAENDIILITTGSLTITNTDAMTVSGAVTVAGTLTVNGVITGDGATEMVGVKHDVVTDIDNEVLTIAESGTVFDNAGDGDGTIFTLPEASTAIGCYYTFVVVAAQSLNINPGAADDRFIDPITNAVGDSIESSTAGDSVTVLCIGDDSWVIIAAYPAATDWPDSG